MVDEKHKLQFLGLTYTQIFIFILIVIIVGALILVSIALP